MAPVSAEPWYAELEASTAALASVVQSSDPDLPIPTCPDWTLSKLATHVGRAHRWATEIVATRSAEFIEFRSVPDGRLPDDPAARVPWLVSGASRLADAIREAGENQVWVFHGLRPSWIWARRMAHETLVHSADALLAAGLEVVTEARFAADAIDEWLTELNEPLPGQPDPRAQALPAGKSLHVHASDPDLDGTGEWLVLHSADGIEVRAGHAKGDVALAGPATDLLLVLLRRIPAASEAVAVHGDRDLLGRWLEQTPF